MDLISQWFKDNLDIVFFLYGLAFFVMGVSILVQPRKDSAFKLADILWLLACFGLIHGINEWLDMWTIIKHQSTSLDLVRLFCLILSFIFLFEFGKRLFLQSLAGDASPWKGIAQSLSWGAYLVTGIIMLSSIFLSADVWKTGSIWTRYLLAFPGALFTGVGFFAYYRFNEKALIQAKVKNYFLWSGLAFILYGFVSGVVVPKGDFFPSSWVNNDSFFSAVHIPVQVFRSALAIVAALSVTKIIRIFDWESRKKIEEATVTDELTGIHNRRGFFAIAEHQLKIANRDKIEIFMLYADIDNFKWINDSLGHKEGDFALKEFARILRNVYRKSDVVGRLGGDEFAVMTVGATGDSVEEMINRLQESLNAFNTASNLTYKLSASVGIAHYDPEHPCSIDELVAKADKKMYEMKRHRQTP
jgi:diguanylate cyclase (GGDEF)-like protein